ncbi:MAG TPA: argininosuccinate lyase [Planctomycetaceae bacterium]|nr:argininosuccinate lyase [Planctomycetaceae bacterium]HRF00616.1 argininosuccinate lyase [Pirellulaceae bacterium]
MASPSRSGAFQEAVDRRVERFTESISFDRRLYRQDVAGSIAHAQMLAERGLLTVDEANAIERTLREIEGELDRNEFPIRIELEDIHMHIEHALIERLGDVGRKLHTGRSRNDQVSTDFRLWVRDALDRIDARLLDLQRAFVGRCDGDEGIVLPAYTHLQRAQPVLAAHYWLAYCEKFERDRERVADCRRRTNRSSLGAAAVAGTSIDIDRHATAARLGFEQVSANSLDISSDRDFAVESVFVLSLIALHLSTWAEEWILWSTAEYEFLELPNAFCTGSSIMPQKINPDVLELTRGKTARVIGDLQTLLVLIKALPLAYNRDLQEDKPAVFDAFDTVEATLELAVPIVAASRLRTDRIEARLDRGFLDATTLMEHLIKRGTPQRTAHHAVGSLVRAAMQQGKRLQDLDLERFREVEPTLGPEVFEVLGVRRAVEAFVSYGSTAPVQVAAQVRSWKDRLASGATERRTPAGVS